MYVGAHRTLKWSIVASVAAVGLLFAIWIWRSESGPGLLLGALTYFAVLPAVLRRAPKWPIVLASAAVGLVIAIWLWRSAYRGPGDPVHMVNGVPLQTTDAIDGAFGVGLLLGAPTSLVAFLVVGLLDARGVELTGEFGMALWLAVVPVNWALLAVGLARVFERKPAARSGPPVAP